MPSRRKPWPARRDGPATAPTERFNELRSSLRHLREDAGISQARLADAAGVSQSLVSLIEAGLT